MAGDSPLNKERFLDVLKHSAQSKDLSVLGGKMFSLFFASIDVDVDGFIQEREHINFFQILDIDEKNAKVSFHAMDTDSDGVLSLEEYVAARIKFLTGEDEASLTKLFMGPLV